MSNKRIRIFYNKKAENYNLKIAPDSIYHKVQGYIPKDSKILDVGCANGNFSKELKKKGCIVYGIEVSTEMAKNARKVLDKVVIGNIEEIVNPFKNELFDVILVMDVLEHLFDPLITLKNVRKLLKKDGRIIVTLPNIANWEIRRELLLGRFDYEETGILDNGHIRFYTHDNAVKLFIEGGYAIKSEDLVVKYPLILLKIRNRVSLLNFEPILKRLFPKLFAFQFIFILEKSFR